MQVRFGGQRAPQPNSIITVTKKCWFKYRSSFSAWRSNEFVGRFNLCMIAVGVSTLRWIYPCVLVPCMHSYAWGYNAYLDDIKIWCNATIPAWSFNLGPRMEFTAQILSLWSNRLLHDPPPSSCDLVLVVHPAMHASWVLSRRIPRPRWPAKSNAPCVGAMPCSKLPLRPCLDYKVFSLSLRHIKSLDICMEY